MAVGPLKETLAPEGEYTFTLEEYKRQREADALAGTDTNIKRTRAITSGEFL